ncbi:MAG: cupredoxin domain-containing protein [Thermomicrobiales bacterium]
MKRLLVIVLVSLFALIPGTPAAQEATPSPMMAAGPSVFVREDPVLGRYLADPAGMTLYLFSNDTMAGESTCYDDCATNWPPFTAEEPLSLPLGVGGELTLIERTDGSTQVAYNGMPLYYFARDQQAGDLTGQGVGDVWWIVAPGAEMGLAATPVTPSSTDMGTPAPAGEVAVTTGDYFIHSAVATFQVGQEYTFNVTNNGSEVHEFVVEPAGAVDEPLEANGEELEIEDIEPGETASLTFTFTEAGNFQFSCHIPSHYPAGMALNIKVVE